MKLIIQPDHGPDSLLTAIAKAKKSIDIVIFRMDRADLEAALKQAVSKGVKVNALIAFMNRGGEKNLRALEMKFLEAGITVSRTADNLIRYHDKLLIVDRRILYVLSFNFTHLDMDHSRAFGISTRDGKFLQEAIRLFEADSTRTRFTAALSTFVVSPDNSRNSLAKFIREAKKQLLIYDPEISDKEMLRLLDERRKAGIEIRVIGEMARELNIQTAQLKGLRLHTRTIIRDSRAAFVGSQSLRAAELDARREVGLIVRNPQIVKQLSDVFEADWKEAELTGKSSEPGIAAAGLSANGAGKATQVLVKELRPLTDTVKKAVKKVVAQSGKEVLEDKTVKNTVKKVIKKAIKQAVREATAVDMD